MASFITFMVLGIFVVFLMKGVLAARPNELAARGLRQLREGRTLPLAYIDRCDDYVRGRAYLELSRLLAFEDRLDLAWEALELAASCSPGACLGQASDLVARTGRHDDGVRIGHAAIEAQPREQEHRLWLADLLLGQHRADEALALYEVLPAEPLQAVGRAEALAALGRDDEAKVLLERARMVIDMRGGVVQGLGGTREDQEACRRLELLGCELFNLPTDTEREVEDALLEARLDARSPDNLTLIGKALMARGGRIAGQLELTSPERSLSDAIRRLKEAPDSLPSLGLQGSAFLRQGRLDRAQVVFRQLRERDASYWPASLGLGAVMRFRRFRLWAALEDLDVYPEPVGLEAVVPDWPALSEEERRVVLASVHPLRFALPILVEAGVCIRVLPLDVRVSDLEELAWTEGLRGAQGQDLSTTSGLATTRLAVVRVEELLDTASPYSWTFGHELAHLALFHLPQEDRERVRALYDRALEHPHVTSWYQASNLDEFFAVSYERWLGFRYQRPLATMADTVGISASIIALFEELMGREP